MAEYNDENITLLASRIVDKMDQDTLIGVANCSLVLTYYNNQDQFKEDWQEEFQDD